MNIQIGKFQNPADFLIRMSQMPQSVRYELTHRTLTSNYLKHLKPQIEQGLSERGERYSRIDTNFQDFAENRQQGPLIQFKEIFLRNCKFLVRNKKSFASIYFNSLFISLIMLAAYHGAGAYPDVPFDTQDCDDLTK
mmetsp:Transcript_17652/g.29827  ORF Transcript_17652/g.29827 Transcript_17652/m.29827 type:complete len:137 (+) Transcript_17652:1225-1635(+)